MMNMLGICALILFLMRAHLSGVSGFTPSKVDKDAVRVGATHHNNRHQSRLPSSFRPKQHSEISPARLLRMSSSGDDDWVSLTGDDCAVKKRIVEEGTGPIPEQGSEVAIDYVGTLADLGGGWSAEGVVDCWLAEQQGLDDSLPAAFLKLGICGERLMDASYFTETFVATELGVANKIQCKKLVMAARRLSKGDSDHPPGTVFDSSADRGKAYKFTLGPKGKAIKAMDLAVSTMKVGERAEIVTRADYAYGKDGLRKLNGDIVVPPFATLSFDVTLQDK